MGKVSENQVDSQDESINSVVKDFVDRLDDEHKMLVVLKSQLYGGSWEPMLEDLNNRLQGKPYIFKLANRIKDDVGRIEKMKVFEEDNSIDLSEFVELK